MTVISKDLVRDIKWSYICELRINDSAVLQYTKLYSVVKFTKSYKTFYGKFNMKKFKKFIYLL